MPIIKSAKKKLRKDIRRTARNNGIKNTLKSLIRQVRRENSSEKLREVASRLDKAAKTKLIHANKAARLKSRLSKATSTTTSRKPAPKGRSSRPKSKKSAAPKKK